MSERIVCLKCGREGHHSASCKTEGYGSQYTKSQLDGMQNVFLAVLLNPAGIRSVEVASLVGLGVSSVLYKLRELRAMGLVDCPINGGMGTMWMLPESVPAAMAARAAEMALVAEAYNERRNALRRKREAEQRSEDECDPPIVRSIIPAGLKPPPHTTGRRWIFEAAHG